MNLENKSCDTSFWYLHNQFSVLKTALCCINCTYISIAKSRRRASWAVGTLWLKLICSATPTLHAIVCPATLFVTSTPALGSAIWKCMNCTSHSSVNALCIIQYSPLLILLMFASPSAFHLRRRRASPLILRNPFLLFFFFNIFFLSSCWKRIALWTTKEHHTQPLSGPLPPRNHNWHLDSKSQSWYKMPLAPFTFYTQRGKLIRGWARSMFAFSLVFSLNVSFQDKYSQLVGMPILNLCRRQNKLLVILGMLGIQSLSRASLDGIDMGLQMRSERLQSCGNWGGVIGSAARGLSTSSTTK